MNSVVQAPQLYGPLSFIAALILALLTPGMAQAETGTDDAPLDVKVVKAIADRAAQGAATAADKKLLEESAPELLSS
ncbi:MAG: hypothetical protein ACRCYX_04050 [Dermatophilaceae bacterium]